MLRPALEVPADVEVVLNNRRRRSRAADVENASRTKIGRAYTSTRRRLPQGRDGGVLVVIPRPRCGAAPEDSRDRDDGDGERGRGSVLPMTGRVQARGAAVTWIRVVERAPAASLVARSDMWARLHGGQDIRTCQDSFVAREGRAEPGPTCGPHRPFGDPHRPCGTGGDDETGVDPFGSRRSFQARRAILTRLRHRPPSGTPARPAEPDRDGVRGDPGLRSPRCTKPSRATRRSPPWSAGDRPARRERRSIGIFAARSGVGTSSSRSTAWRAARAAMTATLFREDATRDRVQPRQRRVRRSASNFRQAMVNVSAVSPSASASVAARRIAYASTCRWCSMKRVEARQSEGWLGDGSSVTVTAASLGHGRFRWHGRSSAGSGRRRAGPRQRAREVERVARRPGLAVRDEPTERPSRPLGVPGAGPRGRRRVADQPGLADVGRDGPMSNRRVTQVVARRDRVPAIADRGTTPPTNSADRGRSGRRVSGRIATRRFGRR